MKAKTYRTHRSLSLAFVITFLVVFLSCFRCTVVVTLRFWPHFVFFYYIFYFILNVTETKEKQQNIVSDSEATNPVFYTLTGPGYDQHPVGVFGFDGNTGMLQVNKPVDREEYPLFTLITNVFNKNTREPTDLPLPIKIVVDDVNDNAPQFSGFLQFSVPEQSRSGDQRHRPDQERTDHVAIQYSLLTGADLFSIDSLTGVISTKSTALDRETKDKHLVIVQIKDMKGASNGLFNTGTATIMLSDINDNPPTFKESSYTATAEENQVDKLILRIPVDDKDLVNSDNWISQFVITKGNENGNFRIDTDPKTNEGLLYVTKVLKLEVSARNKVELQGTSAKWNTATVDVAVTNVDEGPEFNPRIKYITVKENTPNGTVIGTYSALDPETKSGAGIMYYKVTDPALKVANTIDRESSFVQNGIYNKTPYAYCVCCVSATKSGMGTVVIQVDDENDNIPMLPTGELVVCEKKGVLGSVVLVAEDKDKSPFAEPFIFSIPADSGDSWTVVKLNDSAATLQQKKELHIGVHTVKVMVRDLQGSGKEQTVTVRICQCVNGVCLGVLTLLLPFLLLLLLALLLAFLCSTKYKNMKPNLIDDMTDNGGVLLKSNIEAPGDEVVRTLSILNFYFQFSSLKTFKAFLHSTQYFSSMLEHGIYNGNVVNATDTQYTSNYDNQYGMQTGDGHLSSGFDRRQFVHDASLLHTWQTNSRYLDQKLVYMGREDDERYAEDVLHSYGYEGKGSAAGSVGCCSDFAEESLDFVNTLGPKFKTLADVCSKR
uniref:Desmocollin 2 like n=1 Tax=Neogobius melanostomus TaxID=47308 RepID=A0A8C6UXC0_9GOBI